MNYKKFNYFIYFKLFIKYFLRNLAKNQLKRILV